MQGIVSKIGADQDDDTAMAAVLGLDLVVGSQLILGFVLLVVRLGHVRSGPLVSPQPARGL